MTTAYRTPGVYFETFDTSPPAIGLLRTDIAGFVGITERGPLHRPVKIESWVQFTTTYGSWIPGSHLPFAVFGFFANGGRTCWIVRAADRTRVETASVNVRDDLGRLVLVIRATTPGRWGNTIRVTPLRRNDRIERLIVRTTHGESEIVSGPFPPEPVTPTPDRTWQNMLGIPPEQTGSLLVPSLVVVESRPSAPSSGGTVSWRTERWPLSGGEDGIATLSLDDLVGGPEDLVLRGVDTLEKVDEVAIIAIPDLAAHPRTVLRQIPRRRTPCALPCEPAAPELSDLAEDDSETREPEYPPLFEREAIAEAQDRLIEHCEALRDRFAILDLPFEGTPADAIGWRSVFHQTSFAALYYPWIVVDDPLGTPGSGRRLPPSGHVAGVFARSDRTRGVHKPPANEVIECVHDTTFAVDNPMHGELNDELVNAVRMVPGRGAVLMGVRTLDRDFRWRYVNVRRLLCMIEESIDEAMQWTVFEPHDVRLRRQIDRIVRQFLERLFRQGMLDGATSEQAYTVVCDATNNSAIDADAGKIICDVGLQPPFPAEFVIVRIGITRDSVEVEEKGVQDV